MNFLLTIFLFFSPVDSVDWTTNGNRLQKELTEVAFNDSSLDNWATKNLHNGDIISRKGSIFIGPIDFPDYISKITQSDYSHCGIICLFGGKAYVFDMRPEGTARLPLSVYLDESVGRKVLIQRIKPKYNYCIADVMDYIWTQYMDNTKFDYAFVYGGKPLYCAELVNRAYARGKIVLQDPVEAGNLPGILEYPLETFAVMYGSRWYTDNPLRADRKIVFPGNCRVGIIASKKLDVVFEGKL